MRKYYLRGQFIVAIFVLYTLVWRYIFIIWMFNNNKSENIINIAIADFCLWKNSSTNRL